MVQRTRIKAGESIELAIAVRNLGKGDIGYFSAVCDSRKSWNTTRHRLRATGP